MTKITTIHDAPGYRLTARVGGTPLTVELYQQFPQAQHPRDQRIASFTLPPESLRRLSNLLVHASVSAAARSASHGAPVKPWGISEIDEAAS